VDLIRPKWCLRMDLQFLWRKFREGLRLLRQGSRRRDIRVLTLLLQRSREGWWREFEDEENVVSV
jgi:UDP-N-acetyl-D-mannosaminuronic acid transferase (WecB/TagA/CpsF family)